MSGTGIAHTFINDTETDVHQAEIDSQNERSIALVTALGSTCEGTLRGNQFFDGEYYDDMIWSKLARPQRVAAD